MTNPLQNIPNGCFADRFNVFKQNTDALVAKCNTLSKLSIEYEFLFFKFVFNLDPRKN